MKATPWTLEECLITGALLLFLTHLHIPILEPVQNTLFPGASDDRTAMGQLIVMAIWSITAFLMLRRVHTVVSGLRSIGWTTALTGFAVFSSCWSQDPAGTLRKACFLVLTTAFGVYLARCYTVHQQMRMISAAAATIAVLSITFALVLPQYGLDHDAHDGAWIGVFTQKNVCAREMLFLLATLLAYSPDGTGMRWLRRATIPAVLVVIAGTQSKTAFFMTFLLLALFPALRAWRRLSAGLGLATVITAIAALAISSVVAAPAWPKWLILIGRDGTMTGRTAIWHAVLEAIVKRPFLGYGFAAFWLSLRGESANVILALRWAVPAAHNGFLEIWLQVGGLGLLLFLLGFLKAARAAHRGLRQPDFQRAAWPIAVLLLTLFYNLDESSLMQPNDFLWILYVATLTNLAQRRTSSFAIPVYKPIRQDRSPGLIASPNTILPGIQ